MIRYAVKRILILIPLILVVIFIVYGITFLTPGDPARMLLGNTATEERVAALREEMGLDKSFPVQFANYVKNMFLHLDFGTSYTSRQPVSTEIFARCPTTLSLTFIAVVIATVIAIPLGILSAVRQNSAIDSVASFFATAFIAVPSVWLGLMLMIFFSNKLRWFPSGGLDTWKSYVLPSITLAAYSLALYLRMMRSSMLEVLQQDYMRTARGKGIGRTRSIWRHAIKNSLLPVITIIGLDFSVMLGGAVVIENVFAIPGLGRLMVDAIRQKDTPMVLGAAILLSVIYSIVNLIADMFYALIDPRIKSEYVAASASRRHRRRAVRIEASLQNGGDGK